MKHSLRLLVIADVHYAPGQPDAGGMRVALGKELLRGAIEQARRRGRVDAIVLAGDLLHDGAAEGAEAVRRELSDQVAAAAPDAPVLLAPGNHDGDAGRTLAAFSLAAGPREIGGYRFFVFADRFGPDQRAWRSLSDRDAFGRFAAAAGGPVVAVQHNPIHPPVPETGYPYMLADRREVMRDYADAGAVLSISGHFHAGQDLAAAGGVQYFTAPALCEEPFRYAIVTLRGRQVRVQPRQLARATSEGTGAGQT